MTLTLADLLPTDRLEFYFRRAAFALGDRLHEEIARANLEARADLDRQERGTPAFVEAIARGSEQLAAAKKAARQRHDHDFEVLAGMFGLSVEVARETTRRPPPWLLARCLRVVR